MADPYEVLAVSARASEAEVRERYLQLVREFPPDRAPERFAEIRAAFDELRDPKRRLAKQVFSLAADDSLESLTADLRSRLLSARVPSEVLLALADSP
ncbi:MAG TPA: DnaJ domain-containing protein [Pirellulales bacterium]|nr:DnaJ domain-containing protein [Pirellulales bacterium]